MDILWLLSEIRTPLGEHLFQLITYFGQETLILAAICTLYWCISKRFAYQLGFAYFTAGLLIQSLKITFRIDRPWVLDPAFKAVESAVPAATGYSFPSGHTQAATALYGSCAAVSKKRWQKVFFVCCFLLVAFSRLYLGVHTPKDVLVSMAITLFFTWLVYHFQSVLLDERTYIRAITLFMVLASAAVCIYALKLLNNGTIELKYASDCCKAAGAGCGFAAGFYLERTRLEFDTRTKTIWGQLLKLFIGLGITLLLKLYLPELIGKSIASRIFEYFFLVLWVLVIYPYCFSRLSLDRDS